MKMTKKNRAVIAFLLCAITFNTYSMNRAWRTLGWVSLVGGVILGVMAINELFEQQPIESSLVEKPLTFTDLPKDQQYQVIQLLSLNTNAESLEVAAKIINSLAQVNHDLN